MGWNKTTWVDLVGQDTSKYTLNAGNSITGDIDCHGPHKFMTVAIKVVAIFGSSPDADVLVKVYGLDANKANEPDTIPIYSQKIKAVVTSEEIITIPDMDVSAVDSLRVEITNEDSTDSVSIWSTYMAGYAVDKTEPSDETVKVTVNDAGPGYLKQKIVSDPNKIILTELNDGAYETFDVDIGPHVFDKTVDTLDNITDGTIYGKVKNTELFNGQVQKIRAVANGFDVTGDQIDTHIKDMGNPHNTNKAQVGLSNVDNVKQVPWSYMAQPNGVATLDSAGHVPASQLNLDNVVYMGTWNASANTPTLGNGGTGGDKGHYYVVNVAGSTSIDGESDWELGDWIINDGSKWDKVDNSEKVTSVAGKTGAVVLVNTDITNWATAVSAHADVSANSNHRLTVVGNPHNIEALDVPTNTTDFNYYLSAADSTVQKALDTLDDHTHVHDDVTDFDNGVTTSPTVVANTNHRNTLSGNPHDVLASEIDVNVSNFDDILSGSDNTIQKALDTLDDHTHPGGTTPLDTTNFNKYLSSADNTAQKAFDTLDDHVHVATDVTDFDTEVSNNATVVANTAHRNTTTGNPHSIDGVDIPLNTANFGKELSSADNTVQKAFDTLDDHVHEADETGTTTTSFNKYLSSADDTVQKALDTLDDHLHVEADITDLDHNAQKIKDKVINVAGRADKTLLQYRTGSDQMEYVDPKLIGATMIIPFTRNSFFVRNTFLNCGEVLSNLTAYRMIRDGTIVGLSWQTENTAGSNGQIQIYKNGVVTAAALAITSGAAGSQTGSLSLDFNAGDQLSCYVNSGNLRRPVVLMEIIWRQ